MALRSAITDHMATAYFDPHWYLESQRFVRSREHSELLQLLRESSDKQLQRAAERPNSLEWSHRPALEHYLTTYGQPELPPSWLAAEELTIGQLQRLYGNLSNRTDRTAIAKSLGLPDVLLGSWLRSFVRVRNICAHHGRLWNVGLGHYPALPRASWVIWLEDTSQIPAGSPTSRSLYPVLVSLQSILAVISPGSSWAVRLREVLDSHPDFAARGMGVPKGWSDDSFWSVRLNP